LADRERREAPPHAGHLTEREFEAVKAEILAGADPGPE
jgi:hypothetical protein